MFVMDLKVKRRLSRSVTIVLQIYPNGEFTHGVDSSHRRHRGGSRQSPPPLEVVPDSPPVCLQEGDKSTQIYPKVRHVEPGEQFIDRRHGVYTYLCVDNKKHLYAYESEDGSFVTVCDLYDSLINCVRRGELAPLGLSTARNLKKTLRTRRNTPSMTRRMARRIRNAGYLLQQEYGKDNLSFLTLTLPNLPPDELALCCQHWGKLVHHFLMWLKYRLSKCKIPLRYVYCTEIQPERLERRGEYAAHLHLLFRGRYGNKTAWAITPLQARKAWVRCLKSVLNHTRFNQSALENLQRVKHNAAGYISKYMSKGCCGIPDELKSTYSGAISTDWGGMDRSTSRAISMATLVIRGDGEKRHFVWGFTRSIPHLLVSGIIAFYKPGFIELSKNTEPGQQRGLHVGVGRLAFPPSQQLFMLLDEQIVTIHDERVDSLAELV